MSSTAKLIYSAIQSLDGYIEDEDGKFDWAAPDEEMHTFINELERSIGRYLLGRRMYEVMSYWENPPSTGQGYIQDFAEVWRAADKIVYSTTLETASTARTRIERHFDPEAVRTLKAAAGHDLSVGGPALAARAFEAGLVDELRVFVVPSAVGGGKRSLPDNVRVELELLDERRFRQRHCLPPLRHQEVSGPELFSFHAKGPGVESWSCAPLLPPATTGACGCFTGLRTASGRFLSWLRLSPSSAAELRRVIE